MHLLSSILSYRSVQHFVADVHLTFDNAMLYNHKQSDIYDLAKRVKKDFDAKMKHKTAQIDRNFELSRQETTNCLICGEFNLIFEPPVFYCNKCNKKVKRGSHFYYAATGESTIIAIIRCIIYYIIIYNNNNFYVVLYYVRQLSLV